MLADLPVKKEISRFSLSSALFNERKKKPNLLITTDVATIIETFLRSRHRDFFCDFFGVFCPQTPCHYLNWYFFVRKKKRDKTFAKKKKDFCANNLINGKITTFSATPSLAPFFIMMECFTRIYYVYAFFATILCDSS